jgi:hypothetical protein
MNAPVLRWSLFGECGEIVCEGRPDREGFQLSLSNEGAPLAYEWVPDQAALLRRSTEMRAKLKEMGFAEFQPKQFLTGGPYWGPERPSPALVAGQV